MTTNHPCLTIDREAAIATMAASYVRGGYWDAHGVAVRPELADADEDARWRLLDDLAEDDDAVAAMLERQNMEGPLSAELTVVVNDWMVRRAAYAMRVLSEMPVVDGRIAATRAVMCRPEELRAPLGIHWSWDSAWSGGADAHWAPKTDEDLPVIHVVASVPVSSVDWQTTLLCAMDYAYGDDERELRLLEGAQLTVLSVEIGTDAIETPIWPMADGSAVERIA
jgi:hypothetical protein